MKYSDYNIFLIIHGNFVYSPFTLNQECAPALKIFYIFPLLILNFLDDFRENVGDPTDS